MRLSILLALALLGCGAKTGPRLPAVPRLISPLSTARVTTHRPTLSWIVDGHPDAVRVEICADPRCTSVAQRLEVRGDRVRPSLEPGVWFWRARAIIDGRMPWRASETWELRVGALDAEADSSWGSQLDLDRDGFADVVRPDFERVELEVHGGPAASTSIATVRGRPSMQRNNEGLVDSGGDLDGDGFPELVADDPDDPNGSLLYFGDEQGLDPVALPLHGAGLVAAGDVDGDGYGDLLGVIDGAATILYGTREGPRRVAAITSTLRGESRFGLFVAAGDFDADRLGDVAIAEQSSDRVEIWHGSTAGPRFASTIDLQSASVVFLVSIGDADGDGFGDLGVATFERGLDVFASASGSPIAHYSYPISSLGAVLGDSDYDADGRADTAAEVDFDAHPRDRVWIFGSCPAELGTDRQTFGGFVALLETPGDVDGDGFDDLVVGWPEQAITAWHATLLRGGPTGIVP